MKVQDIFTDNKTNVFVIADGNSNNQLEWTIEPTDYKLIPEEENNYFVRAHEVSADKTQDCFISITTPERIAETVIKLTNGKVMVESIYDQTNSIVPAIASECFGDYELFYAKSNPEIGINILKNALTMATNKNVVAEDLGYILRDENRTQEAISAFEQSEQFGPSSEFTYLELSQLYDSLGQKDKAKEYADKFKANGGIE
jgi:tetratricopeptide (TPR) repeat protein